MLYCLSSELYLLYMKIEKKHKESFCAAGIKVDTTAVNESSPDTALIPGLWQQFFSDNIESQIQDKAEESCILGIYWNYRDGNEKSYSMLAGREVSAIDNVSEELVGLEVPGSDYLVFSDEGEMPQIIYTMWKEIWDYFSSNPQDQRKFSYDFECYSTDNTAKVDIYIAIQS